jgi:hypothetical protein
MDLEFWVNFIVTFILGVVLVQISHGKMIKPSQLNLELSPTFFKIIRYTGLFIIIYSCYGVIIEYAVSG